MAADARGAALAARADPAPPEWLRPVLRRLSVLGSLSGAEAGAVATNLGGRTRHALGAPLPKDRSHILLRGWAAAQRTLPDGRRQIFRLLLPGDLTGPAAGPGVRGLQIVAVTPLETTSATALLRIAQAEPEGGLRRALARAAAQDERLLLDQVLRTGQLGGAERLAHLLMELRDRLSLVGLGDGERFPLPVTQDVLADTLGLSLVHVCRLKGRLKAAGLVQIGRGVARVLDLNGLAAAAGRAPQPRMLETV